MWRRACGTCTDGPLPSSMQVGTSFPLRTHTPSLHGRLHSFFCSSSPLTTVYFGYKLPIIMISPRTRMSGLFLIFTMRKPRILAIYHRFKGFFCYFHANIFVLTSSTVWLLNYSCPPDLKSSNVLLCTPRQGSRLWPSTLRLRRRTTVQELGECALDGARTPPRRAAHASEQRLLIQHLDDRCFISV
jgi:hypothetical protein